MLGALGKYHLPLTDTHVLPDAKHDFSNAKTSSSFGIHHLPYGEDAQIGYTRGQHAHRRANRVIIGPGRYTGNVDIT